MKIELDQSADTRHRVLEAAGAVFAEKGFTKATIREIVDRAGANLNAVNYYFRDKRGLYLALFEHAHEVVVENDHGAFERLRELPAEERLHAIVEHLLRSFILTKRAPWQTRLIFREMTEPTGVLDIMVERFIRPRFNELAAVVREIVPAGTSDLGVRLCAESIMAQCGHIAHRRAVVAKLIPELGYDAEGIKVMAVHITAFSLAAMRNLPCTEPEE